MIVNRHQLIASVPAPNSMRGCGCGCFSRASQHQVTNLLYSCRVNGPTVLSCSCLEATVEPKWIAIIFNTHSRANHHKPMLVTDRPYAMMRPDSYLAPRSFWRPADLVQGDNQEESRLKVRRWLTLLRCSGKGTRIWYVLTLLQDKATLCSWWSASVDGSDHWVEKQKRI